MSDSLTTIPLTTAQKETWLNAASTLSQLPIPSNLSATDDPHRRIYVVSFDGTWNDRDHLQNGETATNPAQLEAELSKHYDGTHMAGHYYPGVGTQESPLMMKIDGATGFSAGQIAERAYSDFEKQSKTWIAQDPKADVDVVVMGFSRGSASARHFMNLVDERGVPAGEVPGLGLGGTIGVTSGGSYLRQPGSIAQDALLYDTVATGQEHFLKLGIPDSVQSVVHLTAQNEGRVSFPLLSAKAPNDAKENSRVLEIGLPGAHSDIGGGYPTGPDQMGKYLGELTLQRFGLPVTPGPAPVASLDQGIHDSDWQATQYVKPIEEALHGPGREVQVVHAPTPLESALQNATEQLQYATVSGIPVFNAFSQHTPQSGAGTVEITNDGKGNISILSSVPATSLDLKAGVLNVNGEQVKLTGDDIQAITQGKGIIFNVDHEPDHALRASPAPLPPAQNPALQREMSR
jgi:hypothetical protein